MGTCAGTTNPCSVPMTAARTVTATFTLASVQQTLTVTKTGTGSGTVTSAPGGISCGGDCTENYADGTGVTLTAAAARARPLRAGAGRGHLCRDDQPVFGADDGGANGDRHVHVRVQRTLTVAKAGTGSGTVTSAPGGISCGGDCTENYADGTAVTLTAAAGRARPLGVGAGAGHCAGTTTCVGADDGGANGDCHVRLPCNGP